MIESVQQEPKKTRKAKTVDDSIEAARKRLEYLQRKKAIRERKRDTRLTFLLGLAAKVMTGEDAALKVRYARELDAIATSPADREILRQWQVTT